MNHSHASIYKCALIASALSLTLLAAPARAQIIITPPDACIATFAPVYYNGYASYWCGDNWYYRGRHGWGMYGTEPGFLFSYRGSHGWGGRGGRWGGYGRGRPGGGPRAGGGFRGGRGRGGRR